MFNERRAEGLVDAIQDRVQEQAVDAWRAPLSGDQARGPLASLRRRLLIAEARELAARCRLSDWVRSTGAAAITGVSVEQLEQFTSRLRKLNDRQQHICDHPEFPPAD
jgi:cytochrome c-type biogenesis protein CcmH/NrfG